MLDYLERYTHNATVNKAQAVVIWLHGLGADYNDFVSLVPELKLIHPATGIKVATKFIFPNAPLRPITVNNGYVMRGWYDIYDLSTISVENTDLTGINDSVAAIEQIIDSQIALGFRAQQIIVAGFSQGGVIAYTVGLKNKYPLAGIVALSCYLPQVETLLKQPNLPTTLAIFAAHGSLDQIVPFSAGLLAYQKLYNAKLSIKWHSYQMAHSICSDEITDLNRWLSHVISK